MILLTFTRFYLLRAEDINALPSGYDDYLYCELSEHTFWGRPPDDRSMIRLPAYPLWIRLCHQVGLPLYLGTTLLAISAWLFLIYALRTIRIPRTACALIYTMQLFDINVITACRRATPDVFYGALFVAIISCIFLMLAAREVRQCWTKSALLSVLLGLFAITRAETVMAWVLFLLFAAAFCLRELLTHGWAVRSLRNLAPALLLPAVALVTAPLTVAAANKKAFGVFTSCSLTSSAFTAACNALLAIKPEHNIPWVPVTKDAREKAYAVSPAFAKLRPFLEGPKGHGWGELGAKWFGVEAEQIAGGVFYFALREAVAACNGGRPAQSNDYYWQIARELDRAFREKKLPRRPVWLSFVQPDPAIWGRIGPALTEIFENVFDPVPPNNISSDAIELQSSGRVVIQDTFNRVTYCRSLVPITTSTISGWGFSNGQPVVSVVASEKDGSLLQVGFANSPLPAVYEANKTRFGLPRPDMPLRFSATIFLHTDRPFETAKFVFADGTERVVPSSELRPKGFPVTAMGKQSGWLQITGVASFTGDRRDCEIAARQIRAVAKVYSGIFKIVMIAVLPALVVLVLLRRSQAQHLTLYLGLLPLFGFIVARVVMLSVISASSFIGADPRYLVTVGAPLAAGATILVAQAILALHSYLARAAASAKQ